MVSGGSEVVALKLQPPSENPRVLVKPYCWVPFPEFLIQDREFGMGWGQETGISNKFPSDADAVGLRLTLGEPVL